MQKVNSENIMERRQFIRLEKTLPVKFDLPQNSRLNGPFEALSRNISEGGIFVETDLVQDENLALEKTAALNLEIELLGQGKRIRPLGEIVWVSKKSRIPQKKRNGFGIRFIQLSTKDKQAIMLFISQEMPAQAEPLEKEIPLLLREQKLTDRQRRNLEILDTIRKNRLISRAEISKHTEINIVTVSNYVDNYLKKGLVFERGLDISTGGRRPELLEINSHYGYVLGIDLGLLNVSQAETKVVAADFTNRILNSAKGKRQDDNIEDLLVLLKNLITEVCAGIEIEREKIRGIGIGISGIIDKFSGTVRNPLTGATFTNYLSIKKELEQEFGLPVFIENSACCALFAEKSSGASLEVRGAQNIVYIFCNTQCAIMLKGELYTGLNKSAGQLNLALQRNNSSDTNYCWMNLSLDCIFRLNDKDLEVSQTTPEQLSYAATRLGAKIAYLVNILNPQVVIIGRNFTQLGDAFLDMLRRSVNRWTFNEGTNIVRLIPATLGEEAVAVGAASLVIESALANI